jgi:predicted RNA polymerase sigma factor
MSMIAPRSIMGRQIAPTKRALTLTRQISPYAVQAAIAALHVLIALHPPSPRSSPNGVS